MQVLLGHLLFYFLVFLVGMIFWLAAVFYIFSTTGSPTMEQDIERVLPYLREENFSNTNLREFLRRGDQYQVISYSRGTVYNSENSKEHELQAEDLIFIPEISSGQYYTMVGYREPDGSQRFLIELRIGDVWSSIKQEGNSDIGTFAFLLDENKNILSSAVTTSKKSLSDREIAIMTQNLWKDAYPLKYDFITKQGEKMALVLIHPSSNQFFEDALIQKILAATGVFLLISFFVLVTVALRIRQEISKPLQDLGEAISELSSDGQQKPIQLTKAPRELVDIANTFNTVSNDLYESERKSQELENARQRMLAALSHDLKTPITVIQGYSKVICDDMVPDDMKSHYMEVIYNKSITLNSLIDSLHEFSKSQHPGFQLKRTRVDFNEYFREFIARCYEELSLHGFTIEVDIPEKPYYVQLDTSAFQRVLSNMVNNSLRYNPANTRLLLQVKRDGKELKLILADDGTPISKEQAKTLFQPFVTGNDDSRNAETSGSGLGLAIVKQYVALHGGRVELLVKDVSPYTKIFVITLPLDTEKRG